MYHTYSEDFDAPKLTANFLDFRLVETFGVDFLRGTLEFEDAIFSWKDAADWTVWEGLKGSEEVSGEFSFVVLDIDWSFCNCASWREAWNSLDSKFVLFAAVFLVT